MEAINADKFKLMFKKYKRLDLSKCDDNDLIDFHRPDKNKDRIVKVPIKIQYINSSIKNDLLDTNDWQLFSLNDSQLDGLFILNNILKPEAATRWYQFLLNELPFVGEGLKANISLPPPKPVETSRLRWITFGYHHNWDNKTYNLSESNAIPELIKEFADYISRSLGLSMNPEAGIINYYHCKATLCPHSDYSEPNKEAPLLSLSLGAPAVFLVGPDKDSSAIYPLLLRHGDLLIMSGKSRLAMHSVPRIVCSCESKQSCSTIKRINVNIRQVV